MGEIIGQTIIDKISEIRRSNQYDYFTTDCQIGSLLYGEYGVVITPNKKYWEWDGTAQSAFIESILLDMPLPMLVVATTIDVCKYELIDGVQRVLTIDSFVNKNLTLCGLKILTLLNGYQYEDLPIQIKRRFMRTSMRVCVISKDSTAESRKDIYARINDK